jgi:hypothetical protein
VGRASEGRRVSVIAKILNGDKRGRPARWLVDYYDGAGVRRLVTTRTRDEAKIVLELFWGRPDSRSSPSWTPTSRSIHAVSGGLAKFR